MFVDKVELRANAGNGGDGVVSFRRERYIDKGGPDGGDGGKGGDVVVKASHNQNTLAKFRYDRLLKAENGKPGSKQKKTGKGGQSLTIEVPVGTAIYDSEKKVLFDLANDGQTEVIAKGGKGGFGNAHFTSSTRQTPRIAEKGEDGEEKKLTFELKMIAQVGLVGLPNAGKSTLLGKISNAKPEIASYPFTTIRPNLGVVDYNDESILVADIPGLIEGASEGKGLGDEFLRHVERTKVLIHVIDIYSESISNDYQVIMNELESYSKDLSLKPQIVALNKIDGLSDSELTKKINELSKIKSIKNKLLPISAKSGLGLEQLLKQTAKLLKRQKPSEAETPEKLPVITLESDDKWDVIKLESNYIVSGKKIERFANRTDFNNPHGVQRLMDIMKKIGIMHELKRMGIEAGQTIEINGHKITY